MAHCVATKPLGRAGHIGPFRSLQRIGSHHESSPSQASGTNTGPHTTSGSSGSSSWLFQRLTSPGLPSHTNVIPNVAKRGESADTQRAHELTTRSGKTTRSGQENAVTPPGTAPWYELAFGEHYPELYAHRDDETAAEEIAKLRTAFDFFRPGRLTLDLCCGTGRHAAPLGEMGLQLIGYDLSPALLARARKRPALVGRIVRGDMRRLPFGPHFQLVVNLFTSFGYFPTDEENEQVLTEMGRVLVPRGHLVLDHINAARLRAHLIGEDVRRGPGVQITQRRRLRGTRVLKDVTIERQGRTSLQYQESVRLYDPDEICSLLESMGFREVRFAGSFDGRPFAEDSPRMIVVACKGE